VHPARLGLRELRDLKALKDPEGLPVYKGRKDNRVSRGQKVILVQPARKGIPRASSSTPNPKRKRSFLEAARSACLAIPVIT
tara:strand:- start:1119 stop:1364 length:246 start_codon:yes stop_codon:yes gene_type:complete